MNFSEYKDFEDFCTKLNMNKHDAILYLLDEIKKMKEENEKEKYRRGSKTGR